MICKKQKPAWHRDANFAPCGQLLLKRDPVSFKRITYHDFSWFWKDVTCKKCLGFLEIIPNKTIKRFNEKLQVK